MKKLFILLTVCILFLMAGCTMPNSTDKPTEDETTKDVISEDIISEDNKETEDIVTEDVVSEDKTTEESDSGIFIDNLASDYFANDSHLSQEGKNALSLVDNALNAFVEGNVATPYEKKMIARNNDTKQEEVTPNSDTMELNGLTLEKSGFFSKDNSLGNFVTNMVNIKTSILQLEGLLGTSAQYYTDDAYCFADIFEYKENSIKYLDVQVNDGKIALTDDGTPLYAVYFSLEYNPEDDTYLYQAIMYMSGSMCLYNQSDLRNYGLVYQEVIDSDEDIVAYFSYNELEPIYDSEGNLRDFSEYGSEAYKHIYMPFCQRYYGYEIDQNGYYHVLINDLIDDIVLFTNNSVVTEVSYEEINAELDKIPYINYSLFYLTCGFTKPITNIIELGERPKAYALMSAAAFDSNYDEYHLLLQTEDMCMEFMPFMLSDMYDYYLETNGIFDVSISLGERTLEFKLYSNPEIYIPENYKYFFQVIMANYSNNDHFNKLLEYFMNGYSEMFEYKDEILEYVNTNITVEMFETQEDYDKFVLGISDYLNTYFSYM